MSPNVALLDLGGAITAVFAFLGPADQHKLRSANSMMCEWFDSAAENGSLAFFVTFSTVFSTGSLRWKHATANPRGAGQEANLTTPQAMVSVHARNYYFSTFNAQAGGEADDAIIDKAIIELVADFAFEHNLAITGLFNIRSIGDGFCKGVKAVKVEFKGEGGQLRSVGHGWMCESPMLRSVTFAGFCALEEVGSHWLSYCTSLESIKFASDMSKLRRVEDGWMSSCTSLKHVDLTGFTALEEVGDDWLSHCPSLESIKFAGDMSNLKRVGHSWMSRWMSRWTGDRRISQCPKLKHVDLTGFTALEEVGDHWLSDYTGLESITFAGNMSNLKKIGGSWMSSCSSLKHVDLTGFTALEEVDWGWLSYCTGLESITFAGDMSKLRRVDDNWMSSCTSLKRVDLTGFTALEDVGMYWLSHCPSLESITFAGDMSKLKSVSSSWMTSCSSLKHVDLTGFTALEEVGSHWLSHCTSLESIKFAGDMSKLRRVEDGWMSSCSSLKHVDLTGFTALEEVGDDWLSHCPSLESIKFAGDMSKLKKIERGWESKIVRYWTSNSDCSLSDHLLHLSKLK